MLTFFMLEFYIDSVVSFCSLPLIYILNLKLTWAKIIKWWSTFGSHTSSINQICLNYYCVVLSFMQVCVSSTHNYARLKTHVSFIYSYIYKFEEKGGWKIGNFHCCPIRTLNKRNYVQMYIQHEIKYILMFKFSNKICSS